MQPRLPSDRYTSFPSAPTFSVTSNSPSELRVEVSVRRQVCPSGFDAQVAFFLNPTKVEQVLTACEAGFVLPQKSTYFQPKLGTGLVMYPLDGAAPAPAR